MSCGTVVTIITTYVYPTYRGRGAGDDARAFGGAVRGEPHGDGRERRWQQLGARPLGVRTAPRRRGEQARMSSRVSEMKLCMNKMINGAAGVKVKEEFVFRIC